MANGTGQLTSGTVTVGFTVADVAVSASNFPTGGTIVIVTGAFTATAEFHANHTATVAVDARTWSINLVDGSISEI